MDSLSFFDVAILVCVLFLFFYFFVRSFEANEPKQSLQSPQQRHWQWQSPPQRRRTLDSSLVDSWRQALITNNRKAREFHHGGARNQHIEALKLAEYQAAEVLRCTLLYSPRELDLHGFTQRQAERCTRDFLDYHSGTIDPLTIITGRGNNSRGGIPVLLPAVQSLLRNHHSFRGELDQTGGLIVCMCMCMCMCMCECVVCVCVSKLNSRGDAAGGS
jgi:DNA-nicking Smr family endonuclease